MPSFALQTTCLYRCELSFTASRSHTKFTRRNAEERFALKRLVGHPTALESLNKGSTSALKKRNIFKRLRRKIVFLQLLDETRKKKFVIFFICFELNRFFFKALKISEFISLENNICCFDIDLCKMSMKVVYLNFDRFYRDLKDDKLYIEFTLFFRTIKSIYCQLKLKNNVSKSFHEVIRPFATFDDSNKRRRILVVSCN